MVLSSAVLLNHCASPGCSAVSRNEYQQVNTAHCKSRRWSARPFYRCRPNDTECAWIGQLNHDHVYRRSCICCEIKCCCACNYTTAKLQNQWYWKCLSDNGAMWKAQKLVGVISSKSPTRFGKSFNRTKRGKVIWRLPIVKRIESGPNDARHAKRTI